MGGAVRICQHRAGLPCVQHQQDLLSLSAEAERRERANCRLAGDFDDRREDMGLWPVRPAPAQCQRVRLEP